MLPLKRILLIIPFVALQSSAQDTLKYQWPVVPFNATHTITGTFCEYRNTLSSNHFHNGSDIPMADGSPVYPVMNGTVIAISPSSQSGSNAYVRVSGQIGGTTKNIAYVHIEPNPLLTLGANVTAGSTVLGNVIAGQGHTHIIDGIRSFRTSWATRSGYLRMIIAGSYGTTEKGPTQVSTILYANGDERSSVNFLFRRISFGPGNALLLSSRDEVIGVNPFVGKEIWRWRNKEPHSVVSDVLWMDTIFVVQTVDIRYGSDGGFLRTDPRFYFFTRMYLPDGETSLTGVTYKTSIMRYDGRNLILDLDGTKRIISRER